ncbi:MAG: hypothetical protein ACP5N9_02435 [Candidatus Bilamarchaeum sp.]|jgi:predicted RecA/RadA family phage recombinase
MSCPKCKADDIHIVQIVYGEPTQNQLDAEGRGELVIGGCEWSNKAPTSYCKKCKNKFRDEIL